jgi:LysR family transcriptional regulator, nitrogen assimilation regulatory protein
MIFSEHARNILREVERSRDVLRSHAINPIGKVSVGLPTSACRGLSLPLVRKISERYPNISVHIVEAMTGNLDEWIQMGRLDVALLYDHRAFEHVAWTEMMVEDLVLLVPPHSQLATVPAVSFSQLAELPLVVPGRPNVLRTVIEQIAARMDVNLTATDCDSLPAIREFVRAGSVTIMPHFAMVEEIEHGEMVAIPLIDPAPSWTLSVIVSQRTLNIRASQVVAEVLAEVIAGLVEGGVWKARLRPHGRSSRADQESVAEVRR